MTVNQELSQDLPRITVSTLNDVSAYTDLATDVRSGLSQVQKQLSPKYFYDAYGSELFDQICNTEEYYPTRTEDALLKNHSSEIISHAQPGQIVELGSGACRKTIHLLQACDELGVYPVYQPVDICLEMLLDAGDRLLGHHDWLQIDGVVGDYSQGLHKLPAADTARLFVFLGGTMGNYSEEASNAFLADLHSVMNPDDSFLIGVDRVKSTDVLSAAYNDSAGYTAAFNRNVLSVINNELDGQFDLATFEHHAWFNEQHSRIEMHLRSKLSQNVKINGLDMDIAFRENETILTEISRKFTPDSLSQMLENNDFEVLQHYEPSNQFFSLALARPTRK